MQNKTAKYKLITDSEGKMRYQFFCDLSGSLEYTSEPVKKVLSDNKIEKLWIKEAKGHFNLCRKCGKWINTVMFNADVWECVACAPWEDAPRYCPHCGKEAENQIGNKCKYCGLPLRYEGVKII